MRTRLLSLPALASTVLIPPVAGQSMAADTVDASGTVYAGMCSSEFRSSSDFDALANVAGKRVTFGGPSIIRSSPRARVGN